MTDLQWTPDVARLDSLDLWEHNPKWMSKRRAQRLLDSWRDLNQYQTLAVGPGGECYDGHQRVKTLIAAGYKGDYEVAVMRSNRALTDDERRRVILESTVGTVGNLDWDKLAAWDASVLETSGIDAEFLATLNDDAANLAKLLEAGQEVEVGEDPGAQVDKAQELLEKWGVCVGDVWEIPSRHGGVHRLVCGDCTDKAVVDKVMQGEKADCVATDIPYEVTPKAWDKLPELNMLIGLVDDVSSKDSAFITTSTNPLTAKIISTFPDRYRHSWVWDKKLAGNFMTAKHKPMMVHEDITVLCRGNLSYVPVMTKGIMRTKGGGGSSRLWEMELTQQVNDEYYPRSIIEIGNTDRSDILHPTEKPEPLYRYLLSMYSKVGQIVLDPFLGSGTTLVACENLGRKGRGIEVSPSYVAVTLERLSTVTGTTPQRLEHNG